MYVLALVFVPVLAFFAGIAWFESAECSGRDFDGECDVAGLAGVIWAGCAMLLVLGAVGITELGLAQRRRRQQRQL